MDGRNSTKASAIVLAGFLGAGKTTLLNRVLTADHGRRIAVIVNEFGEIGIDHHLLLASNEQVIQMNNGCLCCTVRGDLLRSLHQLLERRGEFDVVMIETTGLAEPAPVARTLLADEQIRSEIAFGGVVTVVDAKHVLSQLHESDEVCEQIAFADIIVLNKIDLATPDRLDEIEREIRRLNEIAVVHRAKNSDIDLTTVLDLKNENVLARLGSAEDERRHDAHGGDDHGGHGTDDQRHGDGPLAGGEGGGGEGKQAHVHRHLQNVMSFSIVASGALDALQVSQWFKALIVEYGERILRMKGMLKLRGDPDQFVFQGVQTEFEGRPGRAWSDTEDQLNRLVFIGRDLDEAKIRSEFQRCFSAREGGRSAMPDPFGRTIEISPHRLDQIRYWIRQNFGFSKQTPIIIKEVPCVKPACPPIETAIMALVENAPPRLFKVQRPIDEITFDHVYDLMENPMPCC